jgi:putative phosphoesterase
MELAVLGDTHVPSRAEAIPAWVRDRVREADHVVHTGDFDSRRAYERVRGLARGLTAVRGNTDPPELDLPAVASVDAGGLRLVVTHGTGAPENWPDRVARAVREHGGDVGVGGHTHAPTDREQGELRLLNPGSATGAAPADRATMLSVTVDDGDCGVDLLTGDLPSGPD